MHSRKREVCSVCLNHFDCNCGCSPVSKYDCNLKCVDIINVTMMHIYIVYCEVLLKCCQRFRSLSQPITLSDVLGVINKGYRSVSDEEIKKYTDFMVWFASVAKSACPHNNGKINTLN